MANGLEESAENFWGPLIDARFSPADTSRLEMMDVELAVLQKMRTRALRLRNDCTRTCSLPTEIMIDIFLSLRDLWPPSTRNFDPKEPVRYQSGWMMVTHVCSKWRETAVGAPVLWAKQLDLMGTSVRYLPTIVARSRLYPLDLRAIELYAQNLDDVAGWLCQSVAPRIHRLCLEAYSTELFSKLLPQASPHLRNIRSISLIAHEFGMTIELPQPLWELSHVTHLSLKGLHIPWHSAILSNNLVELELHLNDEDLATHPTPAQFREFCHSVQSLRSLHLTDVIVHDSIREIIHLPAALQKFEFYRQNPNYTLESMCFLSSLRFPGACIRATRVHRSELPATDSAIGDLLKSFTLFGDDEQPGPAELSILPNEILLLQDEQPSCTMSYSRFTLHPAAVYPSRWLHEIGPLAYLCYTFGDICPYISSLHLEHLRVITLYPNTLDSQDVVYKGLLNDLASHAPRVHRAQVWISESLPVLHALIEETNANFVLFPRLEVLALHYDAFARKVDEAQLFAELTALAYAIEVRKSKGSPLREVIVSKAMKAWGFWDALRGDVQITFL